jgi:hypothetical protein
VDSRSMPGERNSFLSLKKVIKEGGCYTLS